MSGTYNVKMAVKWCRFTKVNYKYTEAQFGNSIMDHFQFIGKQECIFVLYVATSSLIRSPFFFNVFMIWFSISSLAKHFRFKFTSAANIYKMLMESAWERQYRTHLHTLYRKRHQHESKDFLIIATVLFVFEISLTVILKYRVLKLAPNIFEKVLYRVPETCTKYFWKSTL